MDVARTAVSIMGLEDKETSDSSPEATMRKALRIFSKTPTALAAFYRIRGGKKIIKPKKSNYGLKWKIFGDEQWRTAEIASPENHSFRIKALAPKIIEFAQGVYEPPSTEEYLDSLTMTLLCYESSEQKKQIVLSEYAN